VLATEAHFVQPGLQHAVGLRLKLQPRCAHQPKQWQEVGTVEQDNRQARSARAVRFGVFELDLEAGELRRKGMRLSLQEQPFRVLSLLVTRPGQLVTREQLQEQLWEADTLVDPDLGLNTAVRKIRSALGDSADNPRFIETLPKRGYRFIAPVQEIEQNHTSTSRSAPESMPGAVFDELKAPASSRDSLEAGNPGQPPAENLFPPETVVVPQSPRKDTEQAEPEVDSRSPAGLKPVPVFLKLAAMRRFAGGHYRYFWGPLLVLVMAVISILARQIGKEHFDITVADTDGNKGVSLYRANDRPDQPHTGIGGYDLRSRADQAFAFDYDHSGKSDHLVLYRPGSGIIWILKNSGGTFSPVYEGNGIGGYDLMSGADRLLAFDYDHSGKLDHLVLYRLGTGIICILENDGGGIFTPVYVRSASHPVGEVGDYDLLSPADQVFAFDYDHSRKLDHLALYRSGTGTVEILSNVDGTFAPVCAQGASGDRICTRDLKRPGDQAFAFDYDHSGKLDHLVFYDPGTGAIAILKNPEGTFGPVYEGVGIGGYDLRSPSDRALAVDYEHGGMLDHLLLYRPGTGIVSILRNAGGTFAPVFQGKGIAGYDLTSANDRAIAFDYDHSGKADHLVLYRPGTGIIHVAYLPRKQ
jgi:DNA-binding winged helix-turn-helix (wHTH) protein